MNSPLRYGGETFYQSGYDENDPKVTILQVVRNPSWLTPYVRMHPGGLGAGHPVHVPLNRLFDKRRAA